MIGEPSKLRGFTIRAAFTSVLLKNRLRDSERLSQGVARVGCNTGWASFLAGLTVQKITSEVGLGPGNSQLRSSS